MSAAAQYTRREEVTFAPNVPVTLALKYAQGRTVSGISGERIMYSLVDGRVLFLDLDVAAQIEALGVNVREPFSITVRRDGTKDSPVVWEVSRIAGEQPNGTFIVPSLSGASADETPSRPAATPPKPAGIAELSVPRRRTASELLIEETNALVDAYAEILHRTLTTYQGRIKPEEARSLLVTAYIQRGKFSSAA